MAIANILEVAQKEFGLCGLSLCPPHREIYNLRTIVWDPHWVVQLLPREVCDTHQRCSRAMFLCMQVILSKFTLRICRTGKSPQFCLPTSSQVRPAQTPLWVVTELVSGMGRFGGNCGSTLTRVWRLCYWIFIDIDKADYYIISLYWLLIVFTIIIIVMANREITTVSRFLKLDPCINRRFEVAQMA